MRKQPPKVIEAPAVVPAVVPVSQPCACHALPVGTLIEVTARGIEVQVPRGAYRDHGIGPTLAAALASVG